MRTSTTTHDGEGIGVNTGTRSARTERSLTTEGWFA
jgi:hypothetical protein